MGYKTGCRRYGEFKKKLDEEAKFQEFGRRQWLLGRQQWLSRTPALIGSERAELQVFVTMLPYSGYRATPDQNRISWVIQLEKCCR